MNIRDIVNAKAIAKYADSVASNAIPYFGAGLFPAKKKMGLDLKWFKTHKGLAVSLAPSAFDAKSAIRGREGFKIAETEMPFFRESMIVSEKDEQDIMRVQDANDPYAADIMREIFDDATTLVEGAAVVPERMIFQLLCPTNGHPAINIAANGATYAYDYDPDNTYTTNNYKALSGTSAWTDTVNSDPMQDVADAMEVVEAQTGTRPAAMIINNKTMGLLKKNEKLHGYILAQNATANIFISDAVVKEAFRTNLGIEIVVYSKQYKDEAGVAHTFYADNYCTLIPAGNLGNTWYGTTPEERTLMGSGEADVAVTNTGVAVAVSTTNDPVHTKTTVSEIVLPSYERMDETYVLKVG